MTGALAIFKRELLSLWITPLAWVLMITFLLVQCGVFYSIVVHFSQMEEPASDSGPLNAFLGQQSLLMALTLLLLCPALTMRSMAEERRSGSIESLMAAPVTSGAIVVGKYLACLLTYVLIWLPTLLYAFALRETGSIHIPSLATGYLGVLSVGVSYLALGVLMSTIAKSQLIALLLTSASIFGIFILGVGEYIFDHGPLQQLCAHLSLTSHLEETAQGLIDSRRLVFHFSLALWALFVSSRVVESWRTP